jgi:fumarate reductase flavoprotein subunit
MYNIVEEKSCDFAVAGSGSGMVAAARAAMAGKSVIVLEKTKVVGGGMLFASTMRTFGSRWQKERGLPDVTAAYARKMLDECYWRIEPKLVSNILQATGEFFDWFCDHNEGVADEFFVGRYVFDDETGPLGPQYGGQHNGFGRMVVQKLYAQREQIGFEVLTEHRVVDCEVENGKITALIAETPKGYVRVRCKACLLATGAWVRNREITEKICPGFFDVDMGESAHTNPAYTGDAIPLAEKVGAFVDYDSFCLRLMGPLYMVKNRSFSAMSISPYAISVNYNGRRYTSDPLISHMDQFDGGHVILRQPKGYVFAIFNEDTLKKALESGGTGYDIADPVFAGLSLPDTLEETHADLDAAIAKGEKACFKADTLEELAAQTGIDKDGLLAEVAEYNEYCKNGFDWGFYKPEDTLVALENGPFYAVGGFMATDGAFGGVKVNPDMQAYAKDGGLIEGLYVTGDFASGRHYNMGGVKRQFINDMNWALAGSYIVGDRVVKYLDSLN